MRSLFRLLSRTFKEWLADNPSLIAAGLSFFSIFSLAPLVLIAIAVTARVFRESDAQTLVLDKIGAITSPQTAQSLGSVLQSMNATGSTGSVVGGLLLVWAASRVVAHLQQALKVIWGPADNPPKGWRKWAGIAVDRLRAVALAIGLAAFLLAFFLTDIALTNLQELLLRFLPNVLVRYTFPLGSLIASTVVFTLMFAMMYKWLPARKIAWTHAWAGAVLSSLLFAVGRYGLLLYFRFSDLGSPAGVAGSVILVLLWIYFSAHVFLIGAEFTWVFAHRKKFKQEDMGGDAQPPAGQP